MGPRPETREALLLGAYECLARVGIEKTSVADVAAAASVSRATLYRYFPGGREELLRELVAWEYRRFFLRLYEAVVDAVTLQEVIERGLFVAHRAIADHEVLQLVLSSEPDVVTTTLAAELVPTRQLIAEFLTPYLEGNTLLPGVEVEEAAQFLARMVLSFMESAGRWNLDDPDEISLLVRTELLGGVIAS